MTQKTNTGEIPADEPGTLIKRTQELLKNDSRSYTQLFKDTGVPFFWLQKFAEGKIKNPSVNRVQFLYENLSKHKLPVS